MKRLRGIVTDNRINIYLLESEVRYILSERLESLLMGCNSADRAREYFLALLKLGITEDDALEIFTDEDCVIFKKVKNQDKPWEG